MTRAGRRRFNGGMAAPTGTKHPVNPEQWNWLVEQLRDWEREGLVSPDAAGAIRGRYVEGPPSRGRSAWDVLLWLGGAFVVVGLIWLVASNLDQLSPLWRFVLLAAIWVGLSVGAERLDEPFRSVGRLLAAGAFGAVIFQAAQSVQVPAYEPRLLAAWGIGAALYAYAVRSRPALIVGLGALTAWYAWQAGESADGVFGVVVAFMIGGLVAACAALLQPGPWASFAVVWRIVAALVSLGGIFAAALPIHDRHGTWPVIATIGAAVAVLAVVAAAVRARSRTDRIELAAAAAVALAGAGLAAWRPPVDLLLDTGNPTPAMWVRTSVSVLVFLIAAGWYAVLAQWRSSPALGALALAALVVFTTFQSWAVFAPIISGAALFLIVGLVLLGTGYLAERARRRLRMTEPEGEPS